VRARAAQRRRAAATRELNGRGLHTAHAQLGRIEPGCPDCASRHPDGHPAVAGARPSWEQLHTANPTATDHALTELATLADASARWWWVLGRALGRHQAWCVLCQRTVTDWDYRRPMPASAGRELARHRDRVHTPGASI